MKNDLTTPSSLWEARPTLSNIRDFAYSRCVAPWALLGAALARTLVTVPPWLVLPPIIGSEASLNLFVAVVAQSGGGKGAADGAANAYLQTQAPICVETLGSGEGLVKAFAYKVKNEQRNVRDAVMFSESEVDGLAALVGRSGATLLPQLRKAWSGERLGFGYADSAKKIVLEANRYRLTLLLGVQPDRAGALLGDAEVGGGTPQRLLWLPGQDSSLPDDPPAEPRPLTLKPIVRAIARAKAANGRTRLKAEVSDLALDRPVTRSQLVHLPVPEDAVRHIRSVQQAKVRGELNIDPLDAHAELMRLKVAAGLMVLDGRQDKVTDADWELAGEVMEVSTSTRAGVLAQLAKLESARNRRRGRAEGERAVAASRVTEKAGISRISKNIRAKIEALDEESAGVTLPAVKRALAYRDRDLFEEALDALIGSGVVEKIDGEKEAKIRLVG